MGKNAKELSEEIEARNEALVDEDENFPCEHCEKVFATFSIKATHIKNMHSNTEPHPCELCGKTFGTVGLRETHIKNVHSKLKPFYCEKYGKCLEQLVL